MSACEEQASTGIHCTPKEMYFRALNEGERQRSSLTLHNPTSQRYSFKVKTTSPKSYVVKPSVGFIEPGSSFQIVIIKQRNTRVTATDKFLIEASAATSETTAGTAQTKSLNGNKEIKLIRVPVFSEPDISSSGENNGETTGSNASVLARAAAHLQDGESFPPTPTPQQICTQSPTRAFASQDDGQSISSVRDGLVCMNNNITFRYKAGSNVVAYVRLYNPTDDRYAFKIRSTFPKGFKMKPPQGFVKPRTAVDVEVLLLNYRGIDIGFAKFLVQSFVVDFTDEVITESMYHKAKLYKAVRETELDVQLLGFEDRAESETSVSVDAEKSAAAAYEIRYLRKQLFHMESELQTLRQQITSQSLSPHAHARNETTAAGSAPCVGCMHAPPLFRFRRNRRFRNV